MPKLTKERTLDWVTIIGFILFGIVLIILEIVFVPGTTAVGVLGAIFCGYGIYSSYSIFGIATGSIVLTVTAIIALVTIITAFKGKSWERFSLKHSMKGKFNDEYRIDLEVGDRGVSISSLKPVGKALFDETEIEVRSNGGFIVENDEIEIIRIESNKIFVKSVNNETL